MELKEKKEKIETKRSISDIDALEQFLTCDCIDTSHMDINEILDHKNRDNVKRNIRQIKECIVQFDLLFNVNEESNIKIMMEQYYKLWTVSLNNAESIEKAKRFAVNDLDDEYEIRGQIIHLMETIKNMDDGEFAKLKQTIELCQPKTLMEIFGAYINEKVDKMVNAALLKEMSKKEMQ